jgi:glucokinase
LANALAIDIGGTKVAAARVDSTGEILDHRRVPTTGADAEALFGQLEELVSPFLAEGDFEVCGVGSGGPMEADGETVSPLNIPQWRGFPLRARLMDLLGMRVAVDNDAKALALGEGWCGAAVGYRNYMAMVVSTGVGGGLVIDGQLLNGDAGNAGHIGHIIVDPEGTRCACGNRGCLEAMTSGPAITRQLGHPVEDAPVEVRRRTGQLVGRAVASVVNLLDISLTVVAGSVALGFGEVFFDAAQAELSGHCGLEFTHEAKIIPAGLGPDGPLVGAAAVGWASLGVVLLSS